MITVLRMGHRIARDKRVSTHLALVARQFGADEVIYTGEKDSGLEDSIARVQDKWGKRILMRHEDSWRAVVGEYRKKGFVVVHLTMYGLPLEERLGELKGRDMLVVVGGEKVPAEMYMLADYNISIGNQPHSEIAALAIFLDRLVDWQGLEFGGKFEIVPSERGKVVRRVEERTDD